MSKQVALPDAIYNSDEWASNIGSTHVFIGILNRIGVSISVYFWI